jgi:hypothetical protein
MTQNNNHVWVILDEDDYRCVNNALQRLDNKFHKLFFESIEKQPKLMNRFQ